MKGVPQKFEEAPPSNKVLDAYHAQIERVRHSGQKARYGPEERQLSTRHSAQNPLVEGHY